MAFPFSTTSHSTRSERAFPGFLAGSTVIRQACAVPITTAAEFVRLRTSDESELYHRAAHDTAEVETWFEVIDQYPEMRFWVAQNKTVPIEILRVLAQDDDDRVRSMVAMKRKLPADLCEHLATDPNDAVRMSIARHKNTPTHVLELLTRDAWPEVAVAAAARLAEAAPQSTRES